MYLVLERGENYTKKLSKVEKIEEAFKMVEFSILNYARNHPEFSMTIDDIDDEELVEFYNIRDKKDFMGYWNGSIANCFAMYPEYEEQTHPFFYFEEI
jgi:hypothetical protein